MKKWRNVLSNKINLKKIIPLIYGHFYSWWYSILIWLYNNTKLKLIALLEFEMYYIKISLSVN